MSQSDFFKSLLSENYLAVRHRVYHQAEADALVATVDAFLTVGFFAPLG